MPRYWFRQKTFGYGSTPNTWQGWLLTVIFVALVIGVVVGPNYVIADPATRGWIKVAALIVLTVCFVWFSYIKTEGGWRWRD
jgi:hypothetical protein